MGNRIEINPDNIMPLLPILNIIWIMRNVKDKRRISLVAISIASIILFLATISNPPLGIAYFSANLAYSILLRKYYRYWYLVIIVTIMPLLYPIALLIASRGAKPSTNYPLILI